MFDKPQKKQSTNEEDNSFPLARPLRTIGVKPPPANLPVVEDQKSPRKVEDILAEVEPGAPASKEALSAPLTVEAEPSRTSEPVEVAEAFKMPEVPPTATTPPPPPAFPISMSPPSVSEPLRGEPATQVPALIRNKRFYLYGSLVLILVGLGVLGWWGYQQGWFGNLLGWQPLAEDGTTREVGKTTEPTSGEILPAEQTVTIRDSDLDGLTDVEERSLGTALDSADTDGDGLSDRDEVKIYKTDPLDPDTDKDGYLDGEEVRSGYDPKGRGTLKKL